MISFKGYFFIILLIASLLLFAFPEYDIAFSNLFYEPDLGFVHKDDIFVSFIFLSIPTITKILTILYLFLLIYTVLTSKPLIKSPILFLLLSLILGPGLMVGSGFKENFGRARPRDIVEFGGDKKFSRAAVISDQCSTNCSFSSGHAAMGYYITSFAWVVPSLSQNMVFFAGFLFGSAVGLGRVMQGGHFLSDIIFSFLIVFVVNQLCYKFWIFLNNKIKEKDAK